MDIKSRLEHCEKLAENGATELAQAGLKLIVENNQIEQGILKSIERISYRTGIDIAFRYAEKFYMKGNKSAARNWLKHAKMHARNLDININYRISEIKIKYKDRIPIF